MKTHHGEIRFTWRTWNFNGIKKKFHSEREETNPRNRNRDQRRKKKEKIPDFMSTRSTLPYLEKRRSRSDWRVSWSKFPQKTGLIVANPKQKQQLQRIEYPITKNNRGKRKKTLTLTPASVVSEKESESQQMEIPDGRTALTPILTW